MKPITYADRIRRYLAALNGAEFTTTELVAHLDGYINTTSLIHYMLNDTKEIERTSTKRGHGVRGTYRVRELRPLAADLPKITAKPKQKKITTAARENYPETEQQRRNRLCALQLQAVLDAITRHNRAEACHA